MTLCEILSQSIRQLCSAIRACVWPIYYSGDKDGFAHSQAEVLAGYEDIGAVIVNILCYGMGLLVLSSSLEMEVQSAMEEMRLRGRNSPGLKSQCPSTINGSKNPHKSSWLSSCRILKERGFECGKYTTSGGAKRSFSHLYSSRYPLSRKRGLFDMGGKIG